MSDLVNLENLTLEKLTRDQTLSFLNTTPFDSKETWSLVGIGIEDMGKEYNPQKTTSKWIIHKNATTTTDSHQMASAVSQKCYKGDPVFEYLNNLRRTMAIGAACVTKMLDVDTWNATGTGASKAYEASVSEVNISITKYNDSDAVIEYDIDFNGDPVLGTVTFADGVPTFTKSAE